MQIQQINQMNRKNVNEFILKQWYSMVMVVHGESISLENADGWFASEDEIIIGLITYRIVNSEIACEEHTNYDSVKRRIKALCRMLKEEIIEYLEMNCRDIKL